jgi:hypothetical protein
MLFSVIQALFSVIQVLFSVIQIVFVDRRCCTNLTNTISQSEQQRNKNNIVTKTAAKQTQSYNKNSSATKAIIILNY